MAPPSANRSSCFAASRAEPVAVLIALDRMERGGAGDNLSEQSAVEDFERDYAMPVIPVATVADLLEFLDSDADPAARRPCRRGRRLPAALRHLSPARLRAARLPRAGSRRWRAARLPSARRAGRARQDVHLPVRAERQEGHVRPADPRMRRAASSASSTPDGSLKRIVPPTPTADETSRPKERKEREAHGRAGRQNDAVRATAT